MRKPRSVETPEKREERHDREAQQKRDNSAAEDRAVDEMIRRNIEVYGP